MLRKLKLGFVGSGTMCEAMIVGLLKNGIDPLNITASGPRKDRGDELERLYGIRTTTSNSEAAQADLVVLSVKPQVMDEVLDEISPSFPHKAIVVSIAAGVTIKHIESQLNAVSFVRAMPNLPAQIQQGITVWTSKSLSEEQVPVIRSLFSALGKEKYKSDEKYLDMATALSGSLPGIIFYLTEAFIDVGVRLGFSRHEAKELVLETLAGSAEYARQTQESLASLCDNVVSPAGTTGEAIAKLDEHRVRWALSEALLAAYDRSVRLGK